MLRKTFLLVGILVCVCAPAKAKDLSSGLKPDSVELKSAGPLAFGPDGVLFIGDSSAATVYAIATGDTSGNPETVSINVNEVDGKIAAKLGTTASEIGIRDLAVNPLSGNAYLSVRRGRGPAALGVILRVDPEGEITEVSLKNAKSAKVSFENAPAPGAVSRGRRPRPLRPMSITDIGFVGGRVLVAGLSTEEFASTLRSIPFPFKSDNTDAATGVKIFHGAHGGYETHSPVQTFTTMTIDSEPHLLAAYTCTPLVRIPLSDLIPGSNVDGTTVAELGNRNRPLDMVVYEKDGGRFLLLANDRRGVMKIRTQGIDRSDGIEAKVSGGGTEGQSYDTIEHLQDVSQLDRLNRDHALVVVGPPNGPQKLKTVALP